MLMVEACVPRALWSLKWRPGPGYHLHLGCHHASGLQTETQSLLLKFEHFD